MKNIFYPIKTDLYGHLTPIAMICVGVNTKGTPIYSRGIALRSRKDPWDREKGRRIAYHRMMGAIKVQHNISIMREDIEEYVVVNELREHLEDQGLLHLISCGVNDWKGLYDVEATEREINALKREYTVS
jgi:hypothetical protein